MYTLTVKDCAFVPCHAYNMCVSFFRVQEFDLIAKWDASSWAKKKAKKVKRASLTDFDRFKVGLASKPSLQVWKPNKSDSRHVWETTNYWSD